MAKGGKKKGKGSDDEAPKPVKRRSGLRPLKLGVIAAMVISGPPLYRLVQEGSLDPTAAFTKAGMVALAVAVGVSWLRGLIVDYQADVELDRRRKAARTQELLRMIELENAAKAAEAAAASSKSRRPGSRAARASDAAAQAAAQALAQAAAGQAAGQPGGIPTQPTAATHSNQPA